MAKKFIIGVDLGGTNLRVALLDLKYKIRDREVLNTRSLKERENLISAVIHSTVNIMQNNRLNKTDILGIGLGLPGSIDVGLGRVHFFPNIPGWKDVNLKHILKKRLGLPVFLDNDANLMCLAEYKLGAARGFRNAICLTLGTGVGAGIIIEGKLYRGSHFAAGEIGHVPLNERGPRCNCGGIACLETYIGNKRIIKEAKQLFKRYIPLEKLSMLAKNKNRLAQTVWLKVARHLAVALVGVVNLFNPDVIVIGGGVANAGSILFDEVRETIKERAMRVQAKHVKICKAKLGNDAGLIGAAILVRDSIISR